MTSDFVGLIYDFRDDYNFFILFDNFCLHSISRASLFPLFCNAAGQHPFLHPTFQVPGHLDVP
jgi:hypothetical protein